MNIADIEAQIAANRAGEREEAIEKQSLILRHQAPPQTGNPVPIMHSILRMKGVDASYSRSHLIGIGADLEKAVKEELLKMGLQG